MTKRISVPNSIFSFLGAFAQDRAGATLIEYALIASGISIAIALVVFNVGSSVDGLFQLVVDSF